MIEYISIIITAIFVDNIVFAQFLGICPFIGVSRKLSSAVGMGAAVTFVMAIATLVTWVLQNYCLNPLHLGYMQTIVFILVIAALVQMLEIVLKKVAPALYAALGVFLPLITTNCRKTLPSVRRSYMPYLQPSVSLWRCVFSPASASSLLSLRYPRL